MLARDRLVMVQFLPYKHHRRGHEILTVVHESRYIHEVSHFCRCEVLSRPVASSYTRPGILFLHFSIIFYVPIIYRLYSSSGTCTLSEAYTTLPEHPSLKINAWTASVPFIIFNIIKVHLLDAELHVSLERATYQKN